MYTLSLNSPGNDVTQMGITARTAHSLQSGIRVNGPSQRKDAGRRDGIRVNRQVSARDGIRVNRDGIRVNGPQARYALAG